MVDKALVLRKLAELEQYLGQVREYANVTVEQYSSDWRIQRIVERTLQIMIETCVDVAGHIISDRKYRIPKSYADTFRVLHEENILEKELFETMDKMAKFRNIVVHNYDVVDTSIIVIILTKHLDDFITYENAIINALKDSDDT
jgi:uncharacterized protein YutE (UPF0331/DUF86 family)